MAKPSMPLPVVEAMLSHAVRDVLEDKAFGDSEISWFVDGREVASAYFGRCSHVTVSETADYAQTSFATQVSAPHQIVITENDARRIRHLGQAGHYWRNDEQD